MRGAGPNMDNHYATPACGRRGICRTGRHTSTTLTSVERRGLRCATNPVFWIWRPGGPVVMRTLVVLTLCVNHPLSRRPGYCSAGRTSGAREGAVCAVRRRGAARSGAGAQAFTRRLRRLRPPPTDRSAGRTSSVPGACRPSQSPRSSARTASPGLPDSRRR